MKYETPWNESFRSNQFVEGFAMESTDYEIDNEEVNK